MSLATVIRLEFAYPGVGVLAGDSLQYLSTTTAHGVIMVFYMIMPLVFGAFGNFLLPTQLGVHDVAFPRLNSAAFWFLPGGLIMLCQLVCVDRRYQRMNCFNIRELQGILKRRFFTDLMNSADHHALIDSSMIGLRFKTNKNLSLNHDVLSFYNYGTTTTSKKRSLSLTNLYSTNENTSSTKYYFISFFTGQNFTFSSVLSSSYQNLVSIMSLLMPTYITSVFYSLTALINAPKFLFNSFILNFNMSNTLPQFLSGYSVESSIQDSKTKSFSSSGYESLSSADYSPYSNLEASDEYRFNKFSNPIISYDYKCGHYLGI